MKVEFNFKKTIQRIETIFTYTPRYSWMLEDAYTKRIIIFLKDDENYKQETKGTWRIEANLKTKPPELQGIETYPDSLHEFCRTGQ